MSKQLRPTDVKRLNRQWRRHTNGRAALIVESVTQPFNLGSILRSAAALGVTEVWLAGNTADIDHPGVGKSALGSERKLTWYRSPTAPDAVTAARSAGYGVLALELTDDAHPLHEVPLGPDTCLAVGAEDHGCSPGLLAAVDAAAYIPQLGRVGSLNVAVATAIALSEIRRREWERLEEPTVNGAHGPAAG
ncbi:TrmH family RNA methyltransferase [Lipingzhangella sp. LS1_29]|uniref:TrmH family RNA methyltransferase n=1 Tax=Lipingzhangella rawalii TaxID=2055835 RepID=A0ABU2H1G4_9ACTN|nr:TrmH family RNA methyltransferase [Lipingzhangella rawalii]MDS1269157.1 TrmH family RNA methyltransferase [Lipingzhangella rawalii]